MISGVKATYCKGAIVPLKPLDIEEGADLSISVEVESRTLRTKRGLKALRATAGLWKRHTLTPMNVIRDIYQARLSGIKAGARAARPVCCYLVDTDWVIQRLFTAAPRCVTVSPC